MSVRAIAERTGRLPLEVSLVVIDWAAISLAMSGALEPASREPDALAYGLALLMASFLLARRRWPVVTLLATAAVLIFYYQLDYPGFVPAIPLAVPLYSVAVAGRTILPIVISSFWIVIPIPYRLLVGPEPVTRVINDSLRDGAFFAVIILLGVVVRERRAYAAEVAERLKRAEDERERVAQELRVARLVQQQFLPAKLPDLPGWRIAAFYRSAREVGGDFYSFADLSGGKLGIAIGDVTDKGAPAALVMATTQGLLGAETAGAVSASAVLEKINEVLVLNTPDKMFVTCQYIELDPTTGRLQLANAGHNVPYLSTEGGVVELRATGMPLGLMPATTYELQDAVIPRGSRLLLHSDGLAEAHNPQREMFGFPRVVKVMENTDRDDDLIGALLAELDRFTGPDWEQEDDITLVALERLQSHL